MFLYMNPLISSFAFVRCGINLVISSLGRKFLILLGHSDFLSIVLTNLFQNSVSFIFCLFQIERKQRDEY